MLKVSKQRRYFLFPKWYFSWQVCLIFLFRQFCCQTLFLLKVNNYLKLALKNNTLFFGIKRDPLFPNHHKKKILPTNKIKRYLSMIEASRPEPAIKEEKLKFFISKITIWYYFNIPEATCKAYLVDEKSRLLTKYYSELFQKYYGSGKS